MKRYMDELVETMDGFVEFFGEITIEILQCICMILILITFPIWYLPYKFFRRK